MIKTVLIFGLILIFLLSGCEQIKEIYGVQSSGKEEYVPIEEIKVKEEAPKAVEAPSEDKADELPPTPPQEEAPVVPAVKEEETKSSDETNAEQTKKEGAKVLIAKENDLVSLKPK